jgi:FkbM family methyltransferase|tara:strand:+ start:787 stop:1554 length:768 start_codon:yes stop_codon:yes gene_type:complete
MRIPQSKIIEYYLKNFFLSESYLLKKRANRFFKKQTEKEIRILKQLVDPETASIDIGVYRGVYSYHLLKYSKFVYAFEANRLLFEKLTNGFKKYSNIKLENLAISSSSGKDTLKIPLRNENIKHSDYEELYQLGTATIHQDNDLNNQKFHTIEVNKINLDSYNFNHRIGFIKIDVEGHELEIINGARALISKYKPNMMLEIEQRHTGLNNIKIINEVKKLGYECFILNDDYNFLEVNEDNINSLSNNNFIFKPNN